MRTYVCAPAVPSCGLPCVRVDERGERDERAKRTAPAIASGFTLALMASARGRRAHAGLGQAAAGALSLARAALALRQTRSLPRPHPHRSPLRDSLTQPHTHPGDVQLRTQLPERALRPPVPPATPLAATAPVPPPPTSLPDDRPSPPPLSALSASAPQPEPRSPPSETPRTAQLPSDPVATLDTSSPRSYDAPSLAPSPIQLDLPAKETVRDDIQEEYTEPRLAVRLADPSFSSHVTS